MSLLSGVEYRTAHLRADRALARIAGSGRPIVAGPWLSEVGVELLFWIPFLNWFSERYDVEPERVTAISRGGAGHWYAGIAGRYLDVLDAFEPADLRRWSEERASADRTQKQMRVHAHDRLVLERLTLTGTGGVDGGHALLHPSVMHTRFRQFWNWRAGENRLATVLDRARYEPIARPLPSAAVAALPEGYVAVKAYFNNSFPDTPDNRDFLRDVLERLSARAPVALLDTGLGMDEHADWTATGGSVTSLAESMTARDNLAVQTEAIAGARALFATLGGFSYLAAFLGVPSYSWNSDDERFVTTHHDLRRRALHALERRGAGAPFVHVTPAAWSVLRDL